MMMITTQNWADVLHAVVHITKPWCDHGGGRLSEIIARVPHIEPRIVSQCVHKLVQANHLVELVETGNGKGATFRYYKNIYK